MCSYPQTQSPMTHVVEILWECTIVAHQTTGNNSNNGPPMVDEVGHQFQEYNDNLSSSFVLAVEKLVQQLKRIDPTPSLPVWTSITAMNTKCPPTREEGYGKYTPQGTLWFYLRDHGEDMNKWDRKPTLTLEA